MRTSNILVFIAALFVVISLGYYDLLLKKAYDSGRYKDIYNGYTTLKNKDFDTVDVISSSAANVKFEQGPFSVRVDSVALEYVRVVQTGRKIQITAEFKDGYLFNRNTYLLVIRCPKLVTVNVNARYYINKGKPYIDTIVRDEWHMKDVLINGFKQDTLNVNQDYGSTVVFDHNAIKNLNVTSGKSPVSASKTIVLEDNQFGNASFNIGSKSRLMIYDGSITSFNYHLADSARLELNGVAQQILNNQKPIKK